MNTVIIAFEGIDGSGKTVQMERLKQTLQNRGLRVDTISFPNYDGFFGGEIGKYLMSAEGVRASDVDQKSMALWFAMDRFAVFEAYQSGAADVLLLNRYVLSNAVYQSIRDRDVGKPDLLEFVLELEHGVLRLPQPHAYIYLDVGLMEAGNNVLQKGYREYAGHAKDVYEQHEGIQTRARNKYLEYAEKLDYVHVIPCMENGILQEQQEIAEKIERVLNKAGIIPRGG